MIRRSNINFKEFVRGIEFSNLYEKSAIFIWGVLLYAISFSLFLSPNNIVVGGAVGLSLIVNHITGMDTSFFVFLFSIIILVIGYVTLGPYHTFKTIIGVALLPIFLEFSSVFPQFIDFSNVPKVMYVMIGGLVMGLGNGIIMRSGFSVGGIQTLCQILYQYFGISVGKGNLFLNGVLVVIGGYFFGIDNALYAIIALYISSVVTDRVMLESSTSKTFLIVTDKEKEVSDYVMEILGCGATILNVKGGYSNNKKKMIMCAIPTRKYYEAKEIIKDIDEDAFFLITDIYEICGGM